MGANVTHHLTDTHHFISIMCAAHNLIFMCYTIDNPHIPVTGIFIIDWVVELSLQLPITSAISNF